MAATDIGGNLDDRLRAVETLTRLFRFERVVYLITSTASALMLLVCAGVLVSRHENQNMTVIAGLFGSTGLIAYSLGRLLRMWDQAIGVLMGHMPDTGK